jgi:hypothetical protein
MVYVGNREEGLPKKRWRKPMHQSTKLKISKEVSYADQGEKLKRELSIFDAQLKRRKNYYSFTIPMVLKCR